MSHASRFSVDQIFRAGGPHAHGPSLEPGLRQRHDAASALYRMRRMRDDLFGRHYFPEPRWDMLLFLYMAFNVRCHVSISMACHASAVPSTTALRHIRLMHEDGLLAREPASFDGRLNWVKLSADAHARMDRLMGGLLGLAPDTAL